MKYQPRFDWGYLVVALILAAITYTYLNQMIHKAVEPQDPSYKLIKLTAKTVPVRVRTASAPPEGYRLAQERITVSPSRVTVIGPEALLEDASSAETAIIDISQTTRKIVKSIPLESVAGVHLGGESLPVGDVQRWCRTGHVPEGFLVGASCHSLAEAQQAERDAADYVVFGPVFSTPGKVQYGAPQGISKLEEVCRGVRIPVLAIGGIMPENAAECIRAGAAGIAAIRLFQQATDLAAVVARLRSILAQP